jgi:putative ABC transport system ATP-binding protein
VRTGRPTSAGAPPPLLLDAVSKRRHRGRDEVVVLDRLTLTVGAGEHVGVRGPRRSGKTTLLRIAAGIELPDEGRVVWRGGDAAAPPHRRRVRSLREVAFVGPAHDWRGAPGKPMLDHVALPLVVAGVPVGAALATARDAAEEVGAADCADAAPHELPPELLTRLALARALVRAPRLLVVDDLGAGEGEQPSLDALVLRLVRARPGLAVLRAAREASALRGADRTLSLEPGGRLRSLEQPLADVVRFPRGGGER